jgi:exodeoxyribonuclease VII small subunit
MAAPKAKQSFEELYHMLEEKVALLEQGGLSLDDSLAAYEDAVGLAQKCQQMLDTAELRITRLRETIAPARGDAFIAEQPESYEAEDGDSPEEGP